ncbi:hypothetical protein BDV27DRAFT_164697 [Aspergillus caelatus]|uniref:Aminoglycoside phosphotransferase domain-containing protein n=1 Tax=Aspergillus caelatus TaxID=61420 RepID=A0A5N6ZIM7_9EURO|nr:uncharacterized protein BDV27DRAFT_164697 [Aspergillus caelatus]KAE8357238.1 hypothetical protein BDV27DRAFT_164697 [Aspergillus caelatus]
MASKDNISQPRAIYGRGDHTVVHDEGRKAIYKCGKEGLTIYEPLTLIFINDNTNIPVPKVRSIQYKDGREINVRYDKAGKSTNIHYENDKVFEVKYDENGGSTKILYENDKVVQIIMDFVPGDTLDKVWEGLDDGQKEVLAEDLKKYVSELRELKGKRIEALNGGPTRLITGYQTVQEEWPFESGERFSQFQKIQSIDTRMHASQDDYSSHTDDSSQNEDAQQEKDEIVFTHGDLVPRNILVNDKGNVTALVDWEFAGYYPK